MDNIILKVFRISHTILVHIVHVNPKLAGIGDICTIPTNTIIKRLASVYTTFISTDTLYVLGRTESQIPLGGKLMPSTYQYEVLARCACMDIIRLMLKANDKDFNVPIHEVLVLGRNQYENIIAKNSSKKHVDTVMYEYTWG